MFTDSVLQSLAQRIDSQYTLRHNYAEKPLSYGTAGFRTISEYLPPVAARVATIAAMRAWWCGLRLVSEKSRATCSVGFMITASHNRAMDNGFKIIDTDGGMLATSWEHWCTKAANAATGSDLIHTIKKCAKEYHLNQKVKFESPCGLILLGRDTRESGMAIETAVADILSNVLKITFTSFGVLTTPQLHFLVSKANEPGAVADRICVDTYYEQVLFSLKELLGFRKEEKGIRLSAPQRIVIDCANGVGALGMQRLLAYSQICSHGDVLSKLFSVELLNCNTEVPTALNENCGADYAKQHAVPSKDMQNWPHACDDAADPSTTHFYCLDGDADRIVAFLYGHQGSREWTLIDGDRIAVLYAMLLRKWLSKEQMAKLDVGVVQTAYANGASTEFLKSELRIPVYVAATGVKNLHPVAHARDIGIYFEANGHGTVLFSNGFISSKCEAQLNTIAPLISNLRGLLSQVCGDAICDMLMCEVALRALEMSFEDWATLYTDFPCKQVKVTVEHPDRIKTTQDERRALLPDGLQGEIDAAVSVALSGCKYARSFARPSGTEPVVRVYAEASSRAVCDVLCDTVSSVVQKFCN